jgi:two-component system, OmpR family, sensor histidine kinase TctE
VTAPLDILATKPGARSPGIRADSLAMTSSLRRRLLVMLIAPLVLLTLFNAWFDYRTADVAALQQDRRLLALVPLLADSVIDEGATSFDPPILLLAPAVDEFLREGSGHATYAIANMEGNVLSGEPWLAGAPPDTGEPEFHSQENLGVTWRIVRQRQQTVLGEVVAILADGSDARQQWARSVLLRVLLPNLLLLAAVAFSMRWAVQRALKPLLDLREAVERRSPRDLSAIDEQASPEEVRPLVKSLNRLFGLVNTQAESQRRFIADAAHQLRTPLAGLQAQVEAWAQAANAPSALDGTVRLPTEQVNKLRGATRRTSQLANQLLALSRADARTMQGQPMQRVDLKELCETILEAHLDAATAKRIDLGLEAGAAQAAGHEWQLRELLGNLVDNAVRYTPQGGTVTIRCGVRDGGPFLEVEDDGPGVAPAERPRVLQRFYRVQGTQGEGNGLGLAIADEIARAHHSQLDLQAGTGGRGLRVSLLFGGKHALGAEPALSGTG